MEVEVITTLRWDSDFRDPRGRRGGAMPSCQPFLWIWVANLEGPGVHLSHPQKRSDLETTQFH